MGQPAVDDVDLLDPLLEAVEAGLDLRDHPLVDDATPDQVAALLGRQTRDEAAGFVLVPEDAGSIREEDELLGLERLRHGRRGRVGVDVEQLSLDLLVLGQRGQDGDDAGQAVVLDRLGVDFGYLADDEEIEGQLLNVNADTAAAAVAQAIRAEKLVFLTDTPGILMNKGEPESLIPGLTPEECRNLIERGVIDRGMIPKVEACLTSLEAGVKKTHIIDGRLPHALLLEIFTHTGIGTEIARQDRNGPPGPGTPGSGRRAVLAKS